MPSLENESGEERVAPVLLAQRGRCTSMFGAPGARPGAGRLLMGGVPEIDMAAKKVVPCTVLSGSPVGATARLCAPR